MMEETKTQRFARIISGEIVKQLRRLAADGGSVGTVVSKIANRQATRLVLPNAFKEESAYEVAVYPAEYEPDAYFGHVDCAIPGLVIEISFNYHSKGSAVHDKLLPRLANNYIRQSNGKIKVVIGINVEYGFWEEASISLWRSIPISDRIPDEIEVREEIIRQVSLISSVYRSCEAN